MFIHDFKSIFVHIPKTGGTSITYAMEDVKKKFKHRPDHRRLTEYLNASPKNFWKYHKFTVVRDPVERELSLYNHLVHKRRDNKREIIDHSFTEYLNNIKNDKNFYLEFSFMKRKKDNLKFKYIYADQSDYITLNNQICVDQIIRFEGLDFGFQLLCDKVGLKYEKLTHHRPSSKKTIASLEDIKLIKEIRKKDYELLSY